MDSHRDRRALHESVRRFLGPILWLTCVVAVSPPLAFGQQAPKSPKFARELVKFVPAKSNPVFQGAGPGHWDQYIRERGWILRDDGVFKMWYTGYDEPKKGRRLLGYAISTDGITWKRHPENPIYRDHWVEDMMVVKHDGAYYMFAEGENDLAQLLVSKNGLAWKRISQLDVRYKNGAKLTSGPYGTPTAWFENGVWQLFYERGDRGIWLAKSTDMKVWTNVQDEPVMKPGPADYDKDLIALNQIVKHQGRYYAYYHGSTRSGPHAGKWSSAVATSTDLVHWEKYPGNPLQPHAENKSSGILVPDGGRFRFYTMHAAVFLHLPGGD